VLKRSSRYGVVLPFAFVLLAAACGKSTTATSTSAGGTAGGQQTVAIAFFGAQTGSDANLGINESNGAQLAIDQANAKGDLPVKVILKPFDTQGDPAQAQTVKDKVVSDNQVLAIVGPAFSGESKAANPTFEQAGIVLITPSATNPTLSQMNEKVFHRLLATDEVQGREGSSYIAKGLKAKKVAIIHDNSEYGKGLAEFVQKGVQAAGLQNNVFDAIDPKATDYSAQVNKVKADSPDVVFFGGYYSAAGLLVKQLRDADVKATFLSGDGSKDPGLVQSAGQPASEGVQVTCPCADPSVATDQASKNFTSAYRTKYGKDPGTYSAEAFDSTNIFLDSIRKGNTTRASILDYVNTKLGTYHGLTKDVTFLANGEISPGTIYIYEFKVGKVTEKGTTTELSK
jgi:branched-chain amino acid transport system substrate-binding protein